MILIALGGNLPSRAGAPRETLKAALEELDHRAVKIVAVSPYYVTPAWPDPKDPPFVNAVARVETALSPATLLAQLHQTETSFGRVRSTRNAPRTLDLDLLDYDGRKEPGPPELPHPRIADRAFVLVPLADVAPQWRHPQTGRSAAEMLAALPEKDRQAARPIS